jgi:hypothetical protein
MTKSDAFDSEPGGKKENQRSGSEKIGVLPSLEGKMAGLFEEAGRSSG